MSDGQRSLTQPSVVDWLWRASIDIISAQPLPRCSVLHWIYGYPYSPPSPELHAQKSSQLKCDWAHQWGRACVIEEIWRNLLSGLSMTKWWANLFMVFIRGVTVHKVLELICVLILRSNFNSWYLCFYCSSLTIKEQKRHLYYHIGFD